MIEILLIILQIGFISIFFSYCIPCLKFENKHQKNLINTLSVKMIILNKYFFSFFFNKFKELCFAHFILIAFCAFFFNQKKTKFLNQSKF